MRMYFVFDLMARTHKYPLRNFDPPFRAKINWTQRTGHNYAIVTITFLICVEIRAKLNENENVL